MMKNLKLTSLVLSIITIALTAVSCDEEKELCLQINCINGIFNESTCECDCLPGYEGPDCDTEERAKFLGTFRMTETCDSTGDFYRMIEIEKSTNEVSRLVMRTFLLIPGTNLRKPGYFDGKVDGDNITLHSSVLSFPSQFEDLSGTGSITDSILTISYTFSLSYIGGLVFSDSCMAIGTRM